MSHMKPVPMLTTEAFREYRKQHPGVGLLEAKTALLQQRAERLRQNALDAVEALRWETDLVRYDHTILDVLDYLIKRK